MTPYIIKQVGSFSNSSILVGPLSPFRQIIGYFLKFGPSLVPFVFISPHFLLILSLDGIQSVLLTVSLNYKSSLVGDL